MLITVTTLGVTVSTYLNPLLAPPAVSVSNVVISGSKITMDRPHMSGFTKDGRAYELKADVAVQDVAKPNMVELHKIDAKVEMQDGSTVRLVSPEGDYDSKNEKLKLGQRVLITSTKGYEGRLKEARVDIRKGYVVSDKPVEMKMLQGTLNANRMEIINSGDLIEFDGVHLTTILNTADVKQEIANADDSAGDRTNKMAISDASGKTKGRMILMRLPRADPRRSLTSSSAPKSGRRTELRPQRRRPLNEFSQGSLRQR